MNKNKKTHNFLKFKNKMKKLIINKLMLIISMKKSIKSNKNKILKK